MSNSTGQTVRTHRSGDMHWVGDGFPVRSVFGYNDLGRELSPFLLLDYAAPYRFSPAQERRGVGAHPHRGFETVTIAYQGEIEHRDSTGSGGIIGPGDVQWMTAAKGLLHEEFHSTRFTETGGMFEMVQLWVNLPAKDKNAAPGYQTLLNADIPVVNLPDEAGTARIIAGTFGESKGPAKTFTPINLWDMKVNTGKTVNLPMPRGHTKAVLMLKGDASIDSTKMVEGDLAILDPQSEGAIVVAQGESKLLVLTGQPIEEPVVGYGPFVMNTEAEIEQAFKDFRMGKLGFLD